MNEAFWDIDSFFICGHGLGATVAIDYAIKNSHKVSGLFLIGLKSPDAANSDIKSKENFTKKSKMYSMIINSDKAEYINLLKEHG